MVVESPLGVCQAPGNRQVPSVLAKDLNLGLGTDVFSFRCRAVGAKGWAVPPHTPGAPDPCHVIPAEQEAESQDSVCGHNRSRKPEFIPHPIYLSFSHPQIINSQLARLCKLPLDKLPDQRLPESGTPGQTYRLLERILPLSATLGKPPCLL